MANLGTATVQDNLETATTFVRRAARYWKPALAVLVCGIVVTGAATRFIRPRYRSEAVILYKPGVNTGDLGVQGDLDSPRQVGARLTDSLTSRQHLESLIREFNLYPTIVAEKNYVDATDEMRKFLTFYSREGSSFHLGYETESREQAQKVLKRVVDDVVGAEDKYHHERARETKQFFDVQATEAAEALKAKEEALSTFFSAHPDLALESGNTSAGGTIRAAERARTGAGAMDEVALSLQTAQIQEALAAARRRPDLPVIVGSGAEARPATVSAAEEALRNAERELADKQNRFTDEHPDVKVARRRRDEAERDLKRALAAAASSPVRPTAGALPAAGGEPAADRVASLERALNAARAQLAQIKHAEPRTKTSPDTKTAVEVETEWTRLSREVADARERRDLLANRQFQATLMEHLAEKGEGGRFVLVDPPNKPIRPVSGRRMKVALLGAGATAFVTLCLFVFFGLMDDRLYGIRDVRQTVGDDIAVVVIPRLPAKDS